MKYVVRKILTMILTLLAVTFFVFLSFPCYFRRSGDLHARYGSNTAEGSCTAGRAWIK